MMHQVKTKQGILEGIPHEAYTEFRGVPYAQPPVGALRWHRPLPPEPWEGVREAKCFAARSMQEVHEDPFYDKEFYDEPAYMTPVSEDSLYLNIWTPARSAGEKLPVAFWIHGGAFMGGFGHEKEFDGAAYCLEAAVYCHDDAMLLRNLSKGLYAQLAQRMGTTVSRIERSMRSAIGIAYDRGTLNRHFSHRPTNREFLEYLMNAVDQAERSYVP